MALALLRRQKQATGLNPGWYRPMIDNMPVNVMMADKDTVEITYVNQTSVKDAQDHRRRLIT